MLCGKIFHRGEQPIIPSMVVRCGQCNRKTVRITSSHNAVSPTLDMTVYNARISAKALAPNREMTHCFVQAYYCSTKINIGKLPPYPPTQSKPSAEPKHEYHFDAGCSVSEIKEVRAGGKTIFSFQLNWPQLQNVKEETEAETEGGYNRCVRM